MNRLLIISCPVNPRTLNQEQGNDLDVIGPGENFRWALVEGDYTTAIQQGHGALNDLPFADEALVLMPTVDTRLIHTKVPMISGKKLEALLPILTEPFLLDQRIPLRYQLLPPVPGSKGVERTIAITSDSWMNWLQDQLALLPVRVLTMVPDCLLLTTPEDNQTPREFLITAQEALRIVACREGADWGSGWVESSDAESQLRQLYPEAELRHFAWDWLLPRVGEWMASKSPINLMLQKPSAKKNKSGIDKPTVRWAAKVEWMHWRKPVQLAGIAFAVYVVGSALVLGLATLSNWRWEVKLADIARQHLGTLTSNSNAAIKEVLEETTRSIHAQGNTTPADFVPMTAKLQVLLDDYPNGLLQSIDYRPDGLTFTLRGGYDTPDAEALKQRATHLQMAIIATGKNTYRMLPLAGLNEELR